MIGAWTREEGWLVAVEDTPAKLAKRLGILPSVVEAAVNSNRSMTSTHRFRLREGGYTIRRIAK